MSLIIVLFLALAIVHCAYACCLAMFNPRWPISKAQAKQLESRASLTTGFFAASIALFALTQVFNVYVFVDKGVFFLLSIAAEIVIFIAICLSFGGLAKILDIKVKDLSLSAEHAQAEAAQVLGSNGAGLKAKAEPEFKEESASGDAGQRKD